MDVLPHIKDRHSTGDTKVKPETAAALRQMETELTERKRVQEELSGLIGDLEARLSATGSELTRQKMAVKNVSDELESFSYSVSHDLRAPLRHLIGFSSALVEDFGESLDPAAQSYLDCIARAGRKMENLIEALLGLSRITRREMTIIRTDLGQLARQCEASLRETAPERQVTFLIPDGICVQADPHLMRVVLEHLLGNAWKFTGKKERATIELGHKREGESEVYFVRDDGAGFDPRYAERLFSPFQRMHREEEFPGLGIGLATVQRIIHRHGGRIWAEARVDGGATFFFTLFD